MRRLFGEQFPHHKDLSYKVLKTKIDNLLKDPAKKNTVSNDILILKLIFLLLQNYHLWTEDEEKFLMELYNICYQEDLDEINGILLEELFSRKYPAVDFHRKSLKKHIYDLRKLGKYPFTFADVDARRARFISRNGVMKRALSVNTSIAISGTTKRLCSVIEGVVATITDDVIDHRYPACYYNMANETIPIDHLFDVYMVLSNLKVVSVPSDGLCFISCYRQYMAEMHGRVFTLNEVRQQILEALIHNRELVQPFLLLENTITTAQYESWIKENINDFFRNGQWQNDLCDIIVNSFANLFSFHVIIVENMFDTDTIGTLVRLNSIFPARGN